MDEVDGVDGVGTDGVDPGLVVEALCRRLMGSDDVPGIDGAAVSRCSGVRYTGQVYASSALASDLESLQDDLGEGPGPEALELSSPVLVPDLQSDPRAGGWLGFRRGADALGVRAVFAFPVQVGAAGLGLLTLHGSQPVDVDALAVDQVLHVTDAIALAMIAPELVASLSDDGLDAEHAVTHQAVGMVSVQAGTTLEDALVLLRAHAFANATTLVKVSRDVVARRATFRDGGTEVSREPGAEPGAPGGGVDNGLP